VGPLLFRTHFATFQGIASEFALNKLSLASNYSGQMESGIACITVRRRALDKFDAE
jgi:hypothetical protein